MSGLTEEEKAMIQSVMMKAQEFEKGAPSTMPSPKPSQTSTSQQGSHRPTQSQPQQQPQRIQGGIESGYQQKGGVNQMTSGQRVPGINQSIPQPQPQQQQQQQQQPQHSSDPNFELNHFQQQKQQQHRHQVPQQPSQSQSINQQIRPITSSSQPQNQQQHHQMHQQQPYQSPQNLPTQQNHSVNHQQQQGLQYQNGPDLDQMKSNQQQQDYFQQQQQYPPQQQQQQSQPQPPLSNENLPNQQQSSDNSLISSQQTQQGLIQNQLPLMRNQANQDQNINYQQQQQQQQLGRQQPQIPQGQQQQSFIHEGMNQPHLHQHHQPQQLQQNPPNQGNQQQLMQQSQLTQENEFSFNNQNLQDFSQSKMNQPQSQQQQPNRSIGDNNNRFNNNNLFNNNNNNNNNINNQQVLNSEGSIMFDNMPNERLDEQITDPYGSSLKTDEVHSNHTLIQANNYQTNLGSMDGNNIYQDSGSNCFRNDPNNNDTNNTTNSNNINNNLNQFNQRLNDQFGNQQQFNSGFPKQQQQQSTHQHILPNTQLQGQQSMQHKQQQSVQNSNQQAFPREPDQFSHSQAQLPQMSQKGPLQPLGSLQMARESQIETQPQQLQQLTHQQGPGMAPKPFLDPASLFNQENVEPNLQSTSGSQNPIIQASSSTTITPTGTSFRQLPNQVDIMAQNQLKTTNLQYQQHQHPQQQQQPIHQQLTNQQQQFNQPQLYQQTNSYQSNQFDSTSFMRPNENLMKRDFREYQGSDGNQVNQQQMATMGIKSLTGPTGSTYQTEQSIEGNFSDVNRFNAPFQPTNNPSINNVNRSLVGPKLSQGKPSDSNSPTLTGLIPRTVPLQSVRDQLSSSSVSTGSTSSLVSSSSPSTATSIVSNQHHLQQQHHQNQQQHSQRQTQSLQHVNHPNQSVNCIPVSSSTNPITSNSSSNKHKSSMNLLTQGNSLAYGSNINSMGSLELTNHHLINRGNSINSNDSNNNNDSHSNINSSVNNDNNSYSQQQIHAQQMKRMEIGECWSPVSELSPIQDVSPSIEQAEQRSMQQHQQSLPSVNNTNIVKLNDEYGNGLHRVTSGTISGMLADFNKQMEALSTVSPTDDRSKVQQQHSNRRSSLSRLQLGSSSTNGSIESRSRSGSLSVIGHEPLSYSTLASTAATTTSTSSSSRPSTSSTSETSNLIKSLQTSLLSSSSSTTPSTATSTVASTSAISSTTSSATSSSTNKLSSKSNLLTDIGSNILTSKSDATTLNESSILVTPGNLQLLAQSLPPAQLAIPRTVTHQVELAVSPVVEQTLQQQQMLIQQQQQLIMLQKELFQQQQEQCQKQEQLQKEQEKKKAKQQSTTIQSQPSQGQAQSQQQQQQQVSSSSSGQQTNQMTSSSHSGHHTSDHHVAATSSATSTTASSTASSSVVTSAHRHSQFSGPSSSAPATPNRKDRRRLPQPTIEEIQGAVQAISNQSASSSIYSHGSSLTANKTSTGASQLFGARPISPLIPRKNQVIGVPIIPPMSRSRPTQASTVLTMATPTVVSSSIATTSSLLDPRHGLAASSLGMIRGISPLSMLDETQSEAGGLKNKRRLPLVPLDEEPVTAAAVSRKLIKERLMGKASGGAGNLSCKSVQLLRSASSLDHTPNTGMGLGPLNKDGPGFSGLPLRSRPHSGPISPFSSLSDIANLINSSASGLAGLDLHRPQTPINTLRSSMTGGAGPNAPSEFQTSLANYLGINVSGGANISSGPASVFGLSHKSPFVTSSLPPSSPMTSPLGGGLGLGSGGGYIKSLKSQLKDELKSVVDERLRLLEGRELPREKQDLYRRSETDLQALYDLGSIEMDTLHSRRGLLNRRRPLGGLRRGDTLDPRALGTYSSLLQEPNMMGNRFSAPGLAPELFKSYEYEFLDPGASAYPGLLPTSSLATGRSPFGGPSNNFRRPVSSLGVLGSGLNSTDMAYGLRDRLTNGELDPGLRESFIPNFMDTGGVDGARLLGMGAGHNRFRRRSEGSIDESLLHYDPYNSMNISGVRGYDDLRTNAAGTTTGGHTGYRARPLLGSIGPAHSWHPSPYGSEDEDDKMTREEKATKVRAEIARRRAQLMETGRAVADDLGGGGKLHVGPSGHHPSYYSRDQTQQYNSSAYRRQIGARGNGPMAGEDYSPSGYMDDYYTSGNRCMHGSPTHVRRSRMTRDGLYSRSLDTGYEDYTGAPLHHHPDQQQHQQAYDEYGYYNRGNGINRPVTTDYQPNYNGPNYVANHNLPSQGQSLPANKRPKYPFPVKRILLIRDPKERAHGGSSSKPGNCYGLRLIGGQEIPGTDQVGTFVEKTITGGAVDSLGEIREGDQVLEWNGLPLTGLSNEEVQRLVSASNNAEEVELVIRRDFNLFDVRYDYNSYSQTAPTDGDYYVNNRGQMSQGITAGTTEGDQYYQSP